MTPIEQQRRVVEALERLVRTVPSGSMADDDARAALTSARAVLAAMEGAEPVAWQAKNPTAGCEWFQVEKRIFDARLHRAYDYRELYAASVLPAPGCVSVPLGLAERTEAMFRSVDPAGNLAQEWKRLLAASEGK